MKRGEVTEKVKSARKWKKEKSYKERVKGIKK